MIFLFGAYPAGLLTDYVTGNVAIAVGVSIITVVPSSGGGGSGPPDNLPFWFTQGRLRSM